MRAEEDTGPAARKRAFAPLAPAQTQGLSPSMVGPAHLQGHTLLCYGIPRWKEPSWHIQEGLRRRRRRRCRHSRVGPRPLRNGCCLQLESKLGLEGYGKAKLLKTVPLQAQILRNSGLLFVVAFWDMCYR